MQELQQGRPVAGACRRTVLHAAFAIPPTHGTLSTPWPSCHLTVLHADETNKTNKTKQTKYAAPKICKSPDGAALEFSE